MDPETTTETLARPFVCGTCGAEGFEPSIIPGRCTYCDGTFGGNPPTDDEFPLE